MKYTIAPFFLMTLACSLLLGEEKVIEYDLVSHIIRYSNKLRNPERQYYLTSTSHDNWTDTGTLSDFPKDIYDKLKSQGIDMWPASKLGKWQRGGLNGNGKQIWIQWVVITRIGPTTVDVEDGVYSGGDGGISTVTYEYRNQGWEIAKLGRSLIW